MMKRIFGYNILEPKMLLWIVDAKLAELVSYKTVIDPNTIMLYIFLINYF